MTDVVPWPPWLWAVLGARFLRTLDYIPLEWRRVCHAWRDYIDRHFTVVKRHACTRYVLNRCPWRGSSCLLFRGVPIGHVDVYKMDAFFRGNALRKVRFLFTTLWPFLQHSRYIVDDNNYFWHDNATLGCVDVWHLCEQHLHHRLDALHREVFRYRRQLFRFLSYEQCPCRRVANIMVYEHVHGCGLSIDNDSWREYRTQEALMGYIRSKAPLRSRQFRYAPYNLRPLEK